MLDEQSRTFLQEMNSTIIAAKLRGLGLIPERVMNDIQHSRSKEEANQCLLTFLKDDASEEQVHGVFKSASEDRSCGRMCEFASNTLHQLERGLCMPRPASDIGFIIHYMHCWHKEEVYYTVQVAI